MYFSESSFLGDIFTRDHFFKAVFLSEDIFSRGYFYQKTFLRRGILSRGHFFEGVFLPQDISSRWYFYQDLFSSESKPRSLKVADPVRPASLYVRAGFGRRFPSFRGITVEWSWSEEDYTRFSMIPSRERACTRMDFIARAYGSCTDTRFAAWEEE